MKIRKIGLLIVVVLINLGIGQKEVEASLLNSGINNANRYSYKNSLADIKLEKQIEANREWDKYIELRKELMWYEKEFPQLLSYNLYRGESPAGRYGVWFENANTTEEVIIVEYIYNLLNETTEQYNLVLELQKELAKYSAEYKTFS